MIKEGSKVRRAKDGPNGLVGEVTSAGAATASLLMNSPEPDDHTIFVVWRGDDLGWYNTDELVEVEDDNVG